MSNRRPKSSKSSWRTRKGFSQCPALLDELPLAVGELDQHHRALIDAGILSRREVIDRVGADDLLGVYNGLAQSGAEFRSPRLGARRQRALGRIQKDEPTVECVGAKRAAGRLIMRLLKRLL